VKTSPKRSYSVIENERFGLVFAKTVSIISGTGFGIRDGKIRILDKRTGSATLKTITFEYLRYCTSYILDLVITNFLLSELNLNSPLESDQQDVSSFSESGRFLNYIPSTTRSKNITYFEGLKRAFFILLYG
jgi:hypothetical protein